MQILGIATAPVSFGVFGALDGSLSAEAETEDILRAMASAGYDGSELGPAGFFGASDRVADRLAHHGLRVAGAYIPLHLAEPSRRDADLHAMQQTLAELATDRDARAILADWGTEALTAAPARDWEDRQLALDNRAWSAALTTIRAAMDLADGFGVPSSFHPHVATHVESPWEINRLLDDVDIGLTIDTGHLFLAGGSPTEILRSWSSRVDHVHLKDVRRAILQQAKAEGRRDLETWWADVACPLGEGDVDLDGFIEALRDVDYRGWLVVEQDRAPARPDEMSMIVREQAGNRRWVDDRLRPGELDSTSLATAHTAS